MDTLNDIISGLKWGNLDPIEAHDRVLSLFSVSQRSELLLDFMEHLSTYYNIDEVIDCTKYPHIIEQYEKSNNCG